MIVGDPDQPPVVGRWTAGGDVTAERDEDADVAGRVGRPGAPVGDTTRPPSAERGGATPRQGNGAYVVPLAAPGIVPESVGDCN